MSKIITIAVDAMGGDGSPKKIIDGIIDHHKNNKETFYQIFGDKEKIFNVIDGKVDSNLFNINHTTEKVNGSDTPLEAAKRGKNTSMWLAIESVKNKKADIVISAGNTGALLVISKLNLKMIENIDKPALSALWPNKKGMSVVLDLGANIECSSKNLFDFSIMGASLYTSLYPNIKPNVALLNIGSEELKGNDLVNKYLLNDEMIYGKPNMWIHMDYVNNARNWKDFKSRRSRDLNKDYINICIESIIKYNSENFNIFIINDDSFRKLLENFDVNINNVPEPIKSNVRKLGICKLLYKYGGIKVSKSFLQMLVRKKKKF